MTPPHDAAVAEAARRRIELSEDEQIDLALSTLLSNYQAVTANPRSMGYLRFLLKHYAKDPHPWAACYKDNLKRFGPKTSALCGVLKDTIRQGTHWRHGKGGHPSEPDTGAPGVAIGEADKAAAPPWGGHHNYKLEDVPEQVWATLADLSENCKPCRVMLGLDPAPYPSATFLEETLDG